MRCLRNSTARREISQLICRSTNVGDILVAYVLVHRINKTTLCVPLFNFINIDHLLSIFCYVSL